MCAHVSVFAKGVYVCSLACPARFVCVPDVGQLVSANNCDCFILLGVKD